MCVCVCVRVLSFSLDSGDIYTKMIAVHVYFVMSNLLQMNCDLFCRVSPYSRELFPYCCSCVCFRIYFMLLG